jgi:ligand-binding sensor protein
MLLGKYFETSMSGSVVCGDISEDGEQTWKDNMIYIDDSMSDEEIIKEIKEALLDKEKLIVKMEEMKKRMEKYYLSNFTSNLIGMFE